MSVSHQSQLDPSLTSLPLLDLINPATRVPNVDHISSRQKWPDRYEALEVTQPGTSKPKLRRWVSHPIPSLSGPWIPVLGGCIGFQSSNRGAAKMAFWQPGEKCSSVGGDAKCPVFPAEPNSPRIPASSVLYICILQSSEFSFYPSKEPRVEMNRH